MMMAFQSPPQTLSHGGSFYASSNLHNSVVSFRFGAAMDNNSLIQSLASHGKFKQALQILAHEPQPSQHTHELLILSCTHRTSLTDALALYRHISRRGFHQNPFLASKLIQLFSDLNSADLALGVFHETRSKTIFLWNAIFRALALADRGEAALDLYRKMNLRGIASDKFTYTFVLKACVATESVTAFLQGAKGIHAHALRHRLAQHPNTNITLVDVYSRFGRTHDARKVFDQIPAKDVICWSAMIGCYARNDKPIEALQLFHNMILQENMGLIPNSITMVSVLQACTVFSSLLVGKSCHCYIIRRNLHCIAPISSTLVSMYARCGKLELGQQVFNLSDRSDAITWNSLISSYGEHGLAEKAIQIFKEMIRQRIPPTDLSFVNAIGACSHAGLIQEGKKLFESMRKHRIEPGLQHYSCMVDLLGRAGRLNEAEKLIENMPMDPGRRVWGALLAACRIHGNVRLAEKSSERLIELEPSNAANYVLLADTYKAANEFKKAMEVRFIMENKGWVRPGGCSWMEIRRKTYRFAWGHGFDPFMKRVDNLLAELLGKIKENGYKSKVQGLRLEFDENDDDGNEKRNGHSEKIAIAFGLLNCGERETIRIYKTLRICEDCHHFARFVSRFKKREILIRDDSRFHCFKDGICSCRNYW